MSVRVMTWVWDSHLKPMAKLVALAYADHADDTGGSIYPSSNTVARKTGLDRRSVIRIRRDLEKTGVMVAVKVSRGGSSSRFRMDKQALESIPNSDTVSLSIESQTVTHRHSDSDTPSLSTVTHRHSDSDTVSPEPYVNHQIEPSLNRQERGRASRAAATALDIPIPDTLKAQPAPPRKRAPKLSPANITESDDPRIATYLEHLRSEITQSNAALICERVSLDQLDAWREVCREWAYGNGDASWNPTNFAGMFERYDRKLTARRAKANGHAPQTKAREQPQQFGVGGEWYQAAQSLGWDLSELTQPQEASIGN